MLDDNLKSKIELLQEQIDNLEKSGFFTEKEMDKYAVFYRAEMAILKKALAHRNIATTVKKTSENIIAFFNAMPVEAKILTQNHQQH